MLSGICIFQFSKKYPCINHYPVTYYPFKKFRIFLMSYVIVTAVMGSFLFFKFLYLFLIQGFLQIYRQLAVFLNPKVYI